MKTKLFTLFTALCCVCVVYASNVITYTANAKLSQTTSEYDAGLHTNAFNVAISSHTFANGQGTITFAGEVTSIGDNAFYGCSSLTSITIPNSVTSIGYYAFSGCGLTSVTIPENLDASNAGLYFTKDGIRYRVMNGKEVTVVSNSYSGDVVIPASVTAGNTFSVTSIGESAFDDCRGLTSVTIPNSVTSIGYYAFSGCSGLTSVILNSGVIVRKSGFNLATIFGSQVENLVLGDSVTSIGEKAFKGCSGLTSVTIPNSVTSIGERAFEDCTGLTSVTIPNSVTSIGKWAFTDCSGLTSVTIPNGVTSIGDEAFEGCSGLTSVTIPENLDASNASLCFTKDGIRYQVMNGKEVTVVSNSYYPGDIVIPASYSGDVVIPASVTAGNTFSVTSIGYGAFYECSGLTSVTIPNSVTSIGYEAFRDCTGLTSVTIGSGVTSIGDKAFYECSGLRTVTCLAPQVPTAYANSFSGVSQYTKLYVVATLIEDYQFSAGWNKFSNILPLGASTVPSVEKLQIAPAATTAAFTWPSVASAASYELVIKKDGVVFCTLTFNESGQLTGIAFAPSKADKVQGTSGFQFTVTGLDEACLYSYNFDVKDSGGNVLKNYNGTFSTDGYVAPIVTGVEQTALQVLYTENGRIVCDNANDMRIYTLTGIDVTRENGHLQGIYVVKCGEQAQKVVVR